MKKWVRIALIAVVVIVVAIVAVLLARKPQPTENIFEEQDKLLRESSPNMKVIVLNDGTVARYVGEDESTYTGFVQDSITVAKADATVETWYAYDGLGIVYLKESRVAPVYAVPDSTTAKVYELSNVEGELPQIYSCCGYSDGWFTISIDGRAGYVSEEYFTWDAIDTF